MRGDMCAPRTPSSSAVPRTFSGDLIQHGPNRGPAGPSTLETRPVLADTACSHLRTRGRQMQCVSLQAAPTPSPTARRSAPGVAAVAIPTTKATLLPLPRQRIRCRGLCCCCPIISRVPVAASIVGPVVSDAGEGERW